MVSASHHPEITPAQIASGDPLLKQLIRINTAPVLIGAVFSVVFLAVHGLVAGVGGTFRTQGDTTGFLDDPSTYTNLVSGTLVVAYYLWLPRGIATLFQGLGTNDVIGAPRTASARTVADFLAAVRASFGRRWWFILALALTLIGMVGFVRPSYLDLRADQSAWWTADDASLALSFIWTLIDVYCVFFVFVYSVLTIYWLARLFRGFEIVVRPLHPDRAGGLAPLGTFTLMLSYIITLVGLVLVITPITRNYVAEGDFEFRWTAELVLGLGAYVVVAPVVFFAPLSVAHNAMREAKDRLLLQIAGRFEAEYAQIQAALAGDIAGLEDSLKTLHDLQDLHTTTSRFPVWPLNVQSLTRFATSFVSPLALAVIADVLSSVLE
jgi:hypothetical protein